VTSAVMLYRMLIATGERPPLSLLSRVPELLSLDSSTSDVLPVTVALNGAVLLSDKKADTLDVSPASDMVSTLS